MFDTLIKDCFFNGLWDDDTYKKHLTEEDIKNRIELCNQLVVLFDFISDLRIRREKIQETVLAAAAEKKIFKVDAYRIIDSLNSSDCCTPPDFAHHLISVLFGMYLPLSKRGQVESMTFRELLENQEF